MAVFMLETESVEAAASSLEGLTSELTSLSSNVSSYDTSGEYASEFDFDGPKGVIAANIEACSTKVSNTAVYMNDVVGAHTALQNSLVFDKPKEESKTDNNSNKNGTNNSSGTQSGSPSSNSGSRSSNGGYSSNGGGYTSGGGHSTGGGSTGGGHSSSTGGKKNDDDTKEKKTTPETEPETTPEGSKIGKVDVKDPKVDTVKKDDTELNESGNEIFESDKFKYDENGLATIDGKYVISVGKNFGNVGDEVVITLEDGTKVKCVIGQVTDTEGSAINFFANSDYSATNKNAVTYDLGKNIVKVENYGHKNTYTTENVITNTVEAAAGYAKEYKDGKYSFIIKSYEDAGIKVAGGAAIAAGGTVKAFTDAGFSYFEGKPVTDKLLPGDVLVGKDEKLVMYVGDNKFIADTGTYGSSDSSSSSKVLTASDINKDDYTGVVRYPGVNAKPTNTSSGNTGDSNDSSDSDQSNDSSNNQRYMPQTGPEETKVKPSTEPATVPGTRSPSLSEMMKGNGVRV